MSSDPNNKKTTMPFIDLFDTPSNNVNASLAASGYIQHPESALRSTLDHPDNTKEPSSQPEQSDNHRRHQIEPQEQDNSPEQQASPSLSGPHERQTSPRGERARPEEQLVEHRHGISNPQEQAAVQQDNQGSQRERLTKQQAERRTGIPPFQFSPSRGSLHERRSSRSMSPKKRRQSWLDLEEPPTPTKIPHLQVAGQSLHARSNSRTNQPSLSFILNNFPLAQNPFSRSRPSPKPTFNIFQALLNHQDVVLTMTGLLSIDALISLYAISKDFHTIVNRNATTFMKHYARINAPGCAQIFQFRFYPSLCMRDPTPRPNEDKPSEIRSVPSFRWLRMLVFRQAIVRDLMLVMAADGMRLPAECHETIKKVWLLLDLPANRTRVALIHSRALWTDRDLLHATLWFVKLDMLFSDPIAATGNEVDLRKLLLAQRSLTVLWRALRRELLQTELDVMRLYVEAWYQPPEGSEADGASLLGVPAHLVGRMNHEGWGRGENRLIRPDELVMREGLRRQLRLDAEIMDMMSYGFVDEETWEELPFPGLHRVLEAQQKQREKAMIEEVQREMAEFGMTGGRSKRRKGKGKEQMKDPKVGDNTGPRQHSRKGKEPVRVDEETEDQAAASSDHDRTGDGSDDGRPLDSGYHSGRPPSALLSAMKSSAAPSPANTTRSG